MLPGAKTPTRKNAAPAAKPARDTAGAGTSSESGLVPDPSADPRLLRIDESTVAKLIEALPDGSSEFAQAVDRTLWRSPSADDVARLARVVAAGRAMPLPAMREAASRALSIRLRAERLTGSGPIVNLDADTWATRGAELLRLAAETERTGPALDALDGRPGSGAALAARALLPSPDDLRARSALCSEIASLIETALLGGRSGAWRPIAAADALLVSIESGSLGASELDELEVFAACSAAQRDIEAGGREGLMRSRRLLEMVAAGRQRLSAAERSPSARDASAIRRSAWLRLLAETRVRVDEELTRPHLTSSAVAVPNGGHRAEDPVDARRDASLLAHLRRVRAERRAATRDQG